MICHCWEHLVIFFKPVLPFLHPPGPGGPGSLCSENYSFNLSVIKKNWIMKNGVSMYCIPPVTSTAWYYPYVTSPQRCWAEGGDVSRDPVTDVRKLKAEISHRPGGHSLWVHGWIESQFWLIPRPVPFHCPRCSKKEGFLANTRNRSQLTWDNSSVLSAGSSWWFREEFAYGMQKDLGSVP